MIIANEIKNAWEVIKKAKFQINECNAYYNEDETFSLLKNTSTRLMEMNFSKEEMIAIADWVQCLFIDDGQYEYRNNIEG